MSPSAASSPATTPQPIAATGLKTFAFRAAAALLSLVASAVIARVLGPEGRGGYVLPVAAGAMLLAAIHLSFEQSQVYLHSTRRASLAELAGVAGTGAVLLGLPGMVVLLLLPGGLPSLFAGVPIAWLIPVAAVIPFALHQLYTGGLLVLAHRVMMLNRIVLTVAVLHAAAVGFLAVTGALTVAAVLWLYLGNALILWGWTVRALGQMLPLRPTWNPVLLRRALRFGAALHLGMFLFALTLRADLFMVQSLAGLAPLGQYSLAVMLGEGLWLLTDAVALAVLPRQADMEAQTAALLALRAARVNLLVGCAAGLLLGLVAAPLIRFGFGAPFLPAVPALWWLLPGVVALGVQRPLGAWLLRQGRPARMSLIYAGALGVNLVLNWLWIPRFGIAGAAGASTVAYVASAAVFVCWLGAAADLPAFTRLLPTREDCATLAGLGRPASLRRLLREAAGSPRP